MGIQVPGGNENPFNIGVTPNDTHAMGLVAEPKTKYGLNNLVQGTTKQLVETIGRFQNEIDQTRLQDAMNKMKMFESETDDNPETGWRSLTGAQALEKVNGQSLNERVLQKYKEQGNALREELAPRQRKIFDRYLDTLYAQKSHRLNTHMLSQTKKHKLETMNASYTLAVNDMQSGDFERMNNGFMAAMAVLGQTADITGQDVNIAEKLGGALVYGVGSLADAGKLDEASQWLNAHKEAMGNVNYAKAKKTLDTAYRNVKTQERIGFILNQHPEDELEALKLVEKTHEDIRKNVRLGIHEHYALINAERRARERENNNMAFQMLAAGQDIPPSLWNSLNGKTQLQIENMRERKLQHELNEQKRIAKERQQDPIGTAIKYQEDGVTPIESWQSTKALEEITKRSVNPSLIKEDSLTPSPILAKAELDALTASLKQVDSTQQFQILSLVNEAFTQAPEARERFIYQLKESKQPTYATAFYLFGENPKLAQSYLQGREYIAQGRLKENSIWTVEQLNTKALSLLGNDKDGLGITNDAEGLRIMADAVTGIAAYDAVNGDKTKVEDVLAQVFGNVGIRNGRKFLLPKDANGAPMDESRWFGKSFNDLMQEKQKQLTSSKAVVFFNGQVLPLSSLAKDLDNFELETVGNGQYYLLQNGSYVLETRGARKGLPFVLDVMK